MFINLKPLSLNLQAPDLGSLGAGSSTSATLSGGDDNDVLVLQGGLAGSTTIDGGAGDDIVDYSELLASSGKTGAIVADLAKHTVQKYENGRLVGTDTLIGIEGIVGSRYDDTISGSGNADTMDGAGGNDLIVSAGGNDSMNGGDGDDTIRQTDWYADTTVDGGSGVDTLDYSGLLDFGWGISLNLASGVAVKGASGMPSGVDRISNISAVVGTYLDDTLIGNIAANRLDGGDGRDTILGDKGNDTLNGGAGDDYIEQNWDFESDSIDGGSGNDTVNYNGLGTRIEADLQAGVVNKKYLGEKMTGVDTIRNVEHLIGTDYNDTLRGSGNADILGGNKGDDLIAGAGGNDTLKGFHGSDTLYGDAGDDHLDGDNGSDLLIGGEGKNMLYGGDGDDTIEQQAMRSNDTIDGGTGLDILDYSAIRFEGTDRIFFGLDIDMADGTVSKYTPLESLLKDRFRDIEGVIGSGRHDRISGNDGNNRLDGGAGKDALDGGAGDDTLSGGEGNDFVDGGAGNDQLVQSALRGNDKLDGGAGWDKLDYSDAHEQNSAVIIKLAAGTGQKFLNDVEVGGDVIHNIEWVVGTVNTDQIFGSASTELLDGASGNDNLATGGGNDTLLGGDGDDRIVGAWNGNASLAGGKGQDILDYHTLPAHRGSGNSSLIIDLVQSTVEKYDAGTYTGIDHFSGFEVIFASSFDDEITGDDNANILLAGSGNDVINGGGGDDAINGGDGDDFVSQSDALGYDGFNGDNGHDVLSYTGLSASVQVNLAAGMVTKVRDGLTLSVDAVSNFEEVVASSQADTINGSNGVDTLNGGLGNDVIAGGAGDDLLSGDDNDDGLLGQDGNDYLDGGNGTDSLDGGAGNDRLYGGAGNDVLRDGAGNDYLDGGDGKDVIDGGAGNDLIYGRDGDDQLAAGSGTNVLEGGDGNDIFVPDTFLSTDIIAGGAGFDTLTYTVARTATGTSGGINANLATGKVLKYQDGYLLATDTLSGIEVLNGSIYNDTLTGSDDADFICASAGNDTINGGAGKDLLLGNDGDDRFSQFDLSSSDTFEGGSGVDTLDYSALQGPASVIVSVSVLLLDGGQDGAAVKSKNGKPASDKMDTIRDVENVIGTKNDDQLSGNGANNRLEGGAGNDTLGGTYGNDTLLGGAGDDQLIQSSIEGSTTFDGGDDLDQINYSVDVVGSSIVADLSTGRVIKLQDLIAGGTDTLISIELFHGSSGNDSISGSARAEYINGQDSNDTINGLGGDDYLCGGGGNDILNGGTGNDVLRGDAGNDLYVFDRGFGRDEIENPTRGSADVDVVQFNDVTSAQVMFQRVGNNLTVAIAGSSDRVQIDNWYALIEGTRGEGNISQFKAGGMTLDGNVVMDYVKLIGAPPVSMAVMLGAA